MDTDFVLLHTYVVLQDRYTGITILQLMDLGWDF